MALGWCFYAALKASSIPDKNGTFHACVLKRNGLLRLVTGNTPCRQSKSGEFVTSWDRTGPAGPSTGPAGGCPFAGRYPNPQLDPGAVTDATDSPVNAPAGTNTIHVAPVAFDNTVTDIHVHFHATILELEPTP